MSMFRRSGGYGGMNEDNSTAGYVPALTNATMSKSMSFYEKSEDMIGRYFPDAKITGMKIDRGEISPEMTKLMGCVIVLNCMQIGAECQWTRQDTVMAPIYGVADYVFVTAYIAEIALKFHKMGYSYYFFDEVDRLWNLLDFSLTVIMLVEIILEHLFHHEKFHKATRQVLLLRFVRLFRILRILRSVPELSLLLEGLVTSWTRLTWIVTLLMLLIYIFGIFFTIEADNSIFEDGSDDEEEYFDNLFASMSTLLNVIIGAEWMSVADPILRKQPFLMIPLLTFLVIGSFGILNCIVGVIVDATADSKVHFELANRFRQLSGLSNIWLEKMENAGLTENVIKRCKSGELREKKTERKGLVLDVFRDIIATKTVNFPAGTSAEDLYDVIDESGDGDVSHEEFIVGMGQLLLADPFQLTCQQSVSLAKVRRMAQRSEEEFAYFSDEVNSFHGEMRKLSENILSFQEEMRERMSKVEAQVEKLGPAKSSAGIFGRSSMTQSH